jgi:UbiD family decarboxylase
MGAQTDMHFDDLTQFINKVEELGEVERINGADPHLEIGAIFAVNGQGPNPKLILFDEILGYPKGYRIATNVLGSKLRSRLANNIPLELEGKELDEFLTRRLYEKRPVPPEVVATAPVMDNVMEGNDVDITVFPAPFWHERDGGPFIGSASAVLARDPESGWVNIGSYRSQVFDRNHVGLHTAHGHNGQVIRDKYFERGQDCPVVISLGQEPSLLAAAGFNEPWGVSELDIAGWIREAPVPVVQGPVTGIPIPAGSEIVLEGHIMRPDQEPMRVEGAFGEMSGYYSHIGGHPAPIVRVDAIYYRNNPIICGHPPYKNVRSGDGGERFTGHIMKSLTEAGFHDIRGIGYAGPFMVVSIKQMYAGHAKRVADYLMSGAADRPPRILILVDEDIDPNDTREVFWAVNTRLDPAETVHIYRNMWVSPTNPRPTPAQKEVPLEHGLTLSCMVLDATKPFAWKHEFPPVVDVSPELRAKIVDKWGEYLALEPKQRVRR